MQGQSGLERRGIRVAGIELGLVGGSAGETVNRDEILLASGAVFDLGKLFDRQSGRPRGAPKMRSIGPSPRVSLGSPVALGLSERSRNSAQLRSAPRNEDAGSQMLPSARRSGVKFVCVSFSESDILSVFTREASLTRNEPWKSSTKLTDA